MGRGNLAHGCSYPGCKGEVTHDLILYKRVKRPHTRRHSQVYRTWYSNSKETEHHVYLCVEHAADMIDFMENYEGKEKDA